MRKIDKFLKVLIVICFFSLMFGMNAYAQSTLKSLTADVKSITKVMPGYIKQVKLTAVNADRTKLDVTNGATWVTANNEVATVDKGKITIAGLGMTTIKAYYGGKIVTISVDASVRSLTADVKSITKVMPGYIKQVKLTAVNADGTKLDVTNGATWVTENNEVATVDKGKITIAAPGKTTIKAYYGGKIATISVDAPVRSLTADVKSLTKVMPGYKKQVKLTAVNVDGTPDGDVASEAVWKSLDESIATVDEGEITAVAIGSTKITAVYGGKTVTITFSCVYDSETTARINALKKTNVQLVIIKRVVLSNNSKDWVQSVIDVNNAMIAEPLRDDFATEIDQAKSEYLSLTSGEKNNIKTEATRRLDDKAMELLIHTYNII